MARIAAAMTEQCDELNVRVASLQQEKKVLKMELETYKLRCYALQEENKTLRQLHLQMLVKQDNETLNADVSNLETDLHDDREFSEDENQTTGCRNPLPHENDYDVTSPNKNGGGRDGDRPSTVNDHPLAPPEGSTTPSPPPQGLAVYNKDLVKQLRNKKILEHSNQASLFMEKQSGDGEVVMGMNINGESLKKLRHLRGRYSHAVRNRRWRDIGHYKSLVSLLDRKIKSYKKNKRLELSKSPGKSLRKNKFGGARKRPRSKRNETLVDQVRKSSRDVETHHGNAAPESTRGFFDSKTDEHQSTPVLSCPEGAQIATTPPSDETVKLEYLLEEEATPSSGETSNCSTIVLECKPIIAECLTDAAPEASTAPPSETEKVATKDSPRKRKIIPNTNRRSRDDEEVPIQNCTSKFVTKYCPGRKTPMGLINGRGPSRKDILGPVRKSGRLRAVVSYEAYFCEQESSEGSTLTTGRFARTKTDSSEPHVAEVHPANLSPDTSNGGANVTMVRRKRLPAMLLPSKDGCARFQAYTRISSL